ncbi:hypothetical protein D8T65_23525 [Vibrio vulnificus]|uniref:hypothetical protein n=1 Tax=Vibrio vulnificus TaxID=672 RepID=UPI0010298F35|nr:hypothetical protein [Vibrio vulnificus]RZP96109.1 hypothetical protein D8T65_23525 [Vibrio vulnificus]
MGISTWWEFWFIGIPVVAFGSFALIWSVPGVVMGLIVSFGSLKHIIYIDRELAKDLNKYYDNNGHMRPQYQMTWAVGSRCFDYWMMYPFIRKRSTIHSKKFRLFMWVNALGMWSWVGTIIFVVFAKLVGII